MLHLGKVEVGAGAAFDELLSVMVEVESEIKYGAGHRLVIDSDTGFIQVPSTGTINVLNMAED